jgi:hypothetical protein
MQNAQDRGQPFIHFLQIHISLSRVEDIFFHFEKIKLQMSENKEFK